MGRFLIFLCLAFCVFAAVSAQSRRRNKKEGGGKIVGGVDAKIEDLPYQLSLQYQGSHICGASLISNRYALTAAHCTSGLAAKDLQIRAASTRHNSGGEIYKIRRVINHPRYNKATTENDISLLELTSSVPSSSSARIIALSSKTPKRGDVGVVSGWGRLSEGGKTSETLQKVMVPVVTNEACNRVYGTITNAMWCAGYAAGGKDACQGDSGGPIVVDGRQAGIVSFGAGCARRNAPGVYTNVPLFIPWINDVISGRA